MEKQQRWQELRDSILEGRQRRGGKVDTEVRQAVVGEVQGGLAEGHYLVEMSEWLGVHHATLGRWLREAATTPKEKKKFAKVQIREEVQAQREEKGAKHKRVYRVIGPRGVVVEGMGLAEVAELMRGLGETSRC